MAFEMSCASCDGRMMVETLGIVVACPHCGTHLSIPDEIPGYSPDSSAVDDDDDEDDDGPATDRAGNKSTWVPSFTADDSPSSFPDLSQVEGTEASTSGSNILVSDPEADSEPEVPSAVEVTNPDPSNVIPAIVTDAPASEPVSGFPVLDEPKPKEKSAETKKETEEQPAEANAAVNLTGQPEPEAIPKPLETPETVGDFPGINLGDGQESADAIPVIATDSPEPGENFPAMTDVVAAASAPVVKTTPSAPSPAKADKAKEKPTSPKTEAAGEKKQSVYDAVFSSRRGKLVPNSVFQVWFSYTVLMTFTVIWLIFRLLTSTASNLESLPDVKPLKENLRSYVPEKAQMPPGHTLELNETQRFGNIEVTPLKVTRGNLIIEGLDPEGPVLKLFVKFKNVSNDQTIVPLDEELLFDRKADENRKAGAVANHFVCKASEKHENGNVVLVYGQMIGIEYTLKNQNLGQPLKPGEEVTIYIPTEAGNLEHLQGDLIWRVHFRKGYSPKNYGVTTVFEVKFHSDAIQADSATA